MYQKKKKKKLYYILITIVLLLLNSPSSKNQQSFVFFLPNSSLIVSLPSDCHSKQWQEPFMAFGTVVSRGERSRISAVDRACTPQVAAASATVNASRSACDGEGKEIGCLDTPTSVIQVNSRQAVLVKGENSSGTG